MSAKQVEAVRLWRVRTKEKLLVALGGECWVCGYSKCSDALCFHHVDPRAKEFNLTLRDGKSLVRLLSEAEKCALLCTNCHAEVHAGSTRLDLLDVRTRLGVKHPLLGTGSLAQLVELRAVNSDYPGSSPGGTARKVCVDCGSPCSGTRCRSCHYLSRRKSSRPSKAELSDLLGSESWCALGRRYGVSDNAVRKWARQYGLV